MDTLVENHDGKLRMLWRKMLTEMLSSHPVGQFVDARMQHNRDEVCVVRKWSRGVFFCLTAFFFRFPICGFWKSF